jgi:hypothetical protein
MTEPVRLMSLNAGIRLREAVPPVEIPPGHVGPVVLPGSGRLIWWTGRVAIGLRHQPERHHEMPSQSALWLQELMLGRPASARH